MRLHHLRNATAVIELGGKTILLDPMLGEPGSLPGLKLFGPGKRPNPLVPLPDGAIELVGRADCAIITHQHPDHLDAPGLEALKRLPVYASPIEVPSLRARGLDAQDLTPDTFGFPVETIPAQHGHGALGWMMGPVAGAYLAHPDEPSLYIVGDSVLTPTVRDAITRLRPDVLLVPAGSANFGRFSDILFPVPELVELARLAPGRVVYHHLEALDHCPTTRDGLRTALADAELLDRCEIPVDGDTLEFARVDDRPHPAVGPGIRGVPGVQKRFTGLLNR